MARMPHRIRPPLPLRRFAPALALGLALLGAQPAGAALLGLPFSLPAIGVGFSGSSGATVYDAGSGLLSVVADPTAILLAPGGTPVAVTPTLTGERFEFSLVVNQAGQLVGGVASDDLLLVGRTVLAGLGTFDGELLTGEVIDFGYQNGPGAADYFDFRVRVTGGELAFLFGGADAYVVLGSMASSFEGSFASSFRGGALGNIKATPAVPEPSASLIFAICATLVGKRQRR